MFPTIDATVGMAFVYLLLSLVCSALREAGEALAKKRSDVLKEGLNRVLGIGVADELYRHPLITALADPSNGPAHIPPRTFSTALLDMVNDREKVPDRLRQALRALEIGAGQDALRFQTAIEDWFNSAMDSVTREYKRHTHVWLAVIGLGVTVAMNADSIRMAGALLGNSDLRAAVAQVGEHFASAPLPEGPQAARELGSLGMPIGWSGSTPDNTLPWKQPWTGPWWNNARLLLQWHWAGWLITVAAISLGAPFWFDLLKRFVPAPPARKLEEATP